MVVTANQLSVLTTSGDSQQQRSCLDPPIIEIDGREWHCKAVLRRGRRGLWEHNLTWFRGLSYNNLHEECDDLQPQLADLSLPLLWGSLKG